MTIALDTTADVAAPGRRARPRVVSGVLSSGWTKGAGLVVATGLLVVVVFASLAYGSKPIPLGTVWDAVWDYDGSLNDHLIVRIAAGAPHRASGWPSAPRSGWPAP